MTEEELEEIQAWCHRSAVPLMDGKGGTLVKCGYCHESWPCRVAQLVAEVRRLKLVIEALHGLPQIRAAQVFEELKSKGRLTGY
jgi:hypothetical protein